MDNTDNTEKEDLNFDYITNINKNPKIDITDLKWKKRHGVTKSFIDIDWDLVRNLLISHAETGAGVAGMIGISPITLYRRCADDLGVPFEEFKNECRQRGKDSLRVKMFEAAIKGNVIMQIFLAKNYLGMSDKIEQKLDIKTEIDLTKLSDEEVNTLLELTEKCKVNPNQNNQTLLSE